MDTDMRPAVRARGVGLWAGSVAAVLLSATAAHADDRWTYGNGNGVASTLKHSVSGRFTPALQIIDNGDDSQGRIGDLPSHQSMVRFKGRTMDEGLYSWGYKAEIGLNYNSLQDQDFSGTVNSPVWNIRTAETWYKGPWGKVKLGQGTGAARYATRTDLLPTKILSTYDFRALMSAPLHTDAGTSSTTAGDLFPELAGDRSGRIRYVSPRFGGFQFGASYAPDNDEQELQVRYRTGTGPDDAKVNVGGTEVQIDTTLGYIRGAVGDSPFTSGPGDPVESRIAWSGSARYDNAVLTLAYGNQHYKDNFLGTNWATYVKGGYIFGNQTVSGSYGWSRGLHTSDLGKVEGLIYELAYYLDMDPYEVAVAISQLQADSTESGAPGVDDMRRIITTFAVDF